MNSTTKHGLDLYSTFQIEGVSSVSVANTDTSTYIQNIALTYLAQFRLKACQVSVWQTLTQVLAFKTWSY